MRTRQDRTVLHLCMVRRYCKHRRGEQRKGVGGEIDIALAPIIPSCKSLKMFFSAQIDTVQE